MSNRDRLLIVDDDRDLTRLVKQFLEQNGFQVTVEHDGDKAVALVHAMDPALVILDVMLPGQNGLDICRELRSFYSGPVLMLTALDDDIDEVAGLEVGADDYLAKPVRSRVLLAHVRALLRRTEVYSEKSKAPERSSDTGKQVYGYNDLQIFAGSRVVKRGDLEVELTTAEFNLLLFLAENQGRIVSRDEVYLKIFNLEYDGVDRSIDLRISRLRKKLERDPKSPEIIKTIRGVGYLFSQEMA